jgi:hypothetical protein
MRGPSPAGPAFAGAGRALVGRTAPAGAPPLRRDQTSLKLPTRLPIDDWLRIGQTLTRAADSAAWWLGDWLVYGQDRYPERYRHAIDDTSLDYQTLRNYAWIARKIPPSRRRAGLSMQHHAEVAAMSPALQDTWLDRAGSTGWSRNELRRRIRAEATPSFPDRPSAAETATESADLRLRVSAERHRRYTTAAQRADRDLSRWMLDVLDSAALVPSQEN